MSSAPAPAGNFFPDGPPARQRYNTPTQMQPLDFGEDISIGPDSEDSVTSVGQLGAAPGAAAPHGYDPRSAGRPFDPRGSQTQQAAPQRQPSAAYPAAQPMSAPFGAAPAHGAHDRYAAPAHGQPYAQGAPPPHDPRAQAHPPHSEAHYAPQGAPYAPPPDRYGADPYGARPHAPSDRFPADPYGQRAPAPSDRHGSERYPAHAPAPDGYGQRPPPDRHGADPYASQPGARAYPQGSGGYPQAAPTGPDPYARPAPPAYDPRSHGAPPAHDLYGGPGAPPPHDPYARAAPPGYDARGHAAPNAHDPYGHARAPEHAPQHAYDRYGGAPGHAPPLAAPHPASPYGHGAPAPMHAEAAAPRRSAFPPLDTSEVMVSLVSVTKTFEKGGQSLTILTDLSLELPKGGYVALMGPSGSGKSTLLNLLAGLDRPTSGSITIGGARIDSLSDSQLAQWRANNVGFIFQSYNLMPVLNAQENVELPLLLTKLPSAERKRRAQTALRIVGLEERMKHYPKQLSGGQEQRVAIARAIVNDPAIIIADEPTGDLDRKSADEILTLMEKLNTELGKTIVMVTHDPQAAERARELKRLDKGRLV